MKSLCNVCIVILFWQICIFASKDTLKKYQGDFGINLSQISFNNWSQGGENALTWTLYTNLGARYSDSVWSLKNNLKVAYGRTKIGAAEYRTNDNELYLESVLSYRLGWSVDPYISNTVRSGLSRGYDYKKSLTAPVSNFFDPGYIAQSMGFEFGKAKVIVSRLGIGLQEVFTNRYRNYTDDATTREVEAFKLDTGMESVTDTKIVLDENLLYQAKLRLFTRFTSLDVWDVRWDHLVTAKVTKYLNVNLNIIVLYEKSQSPRTQLKAALQMGLTYSLI